MKCLSVIIALLVSTQVWAIDEYYVSQPMEGRLGQFKKDSVRVLRDTVFFNSSLKPLQTTHAIRNYITVGLDEYTLNRFPDVFAANVEVEIKYYLPNPAYPWQPNETISYSFNTSFSISYNKNTGAQYAAKQVYQLSGAVQLEAKIVSISATTGNLADFESVLVLKNEMYVNRTYSFNCAVDKVQSLTTPVMTAGELQVSWDFVRVTDEFDLEWTYISQAAAGDYQTNGVYDAKKIFRNNASRVSITQNQYKIPMLYDDTGTVFYRVRPVQLLYGGQRLEGMWSTENAGGLGQYQYNGHEPYLNWQSTTTYAEEGKRKSVVQYFDGSLRGRQTVTKDNSTDSTVVAETFYDYQGRPVIQVLPAPSLSNIIAYTPRFNVDINGAEYSRDKYDGLMGSSNYCLNAAAPMGQQSGASKYYSPSNQNINNGYHRYIPDAKNYPFTETRYTQDNTGRILAQGGVGRPYQLDSGHATKYYYGSADQEDIDGLFGTEAGNYTHYFKNMVRDANGQYSVSYVDMHGRTIATALAGNVPASVGGMDSYRNLAVTKKLLDKSNNMVKGTVIESAKSLLVTQAGSYQFNYSMNADTIKALACSSGQQLCYDCLYDLEITITDDCNNENLPGLKPYVISRRNFTLGQLDTLCNTPALGISVAETLTLAEGSYLVTKRLSVSRYAMDYYRDSIYLARACKTLDDFINEERTAYLTGLNCENSCSACTTALGSWASFRPKYMTENGIAPADSAGYRSQAYTSYLSLQKECDALCNPLPGAHTAIREQLLTDMMPPYGQYANPDLIDANSIFAKKAGAGAAYTTISNYTNEDGTEAFVTIEDENGNEKRWKPNELPAALFIEYFEESWANALLQLHPEYLKLQLYEKAPDFVNSHNWDADFENTETYAAALAKGYLNPLGMAVPFTAGNDPFFNTANNPGYALVWRSQMQTALTNAVQYENGGAWTDMWSLATIQAQCGPNDASCINNYKNNDHRFEIDPACGGTLDAAWQSFRNMYLAKKRALINTILDQEYSSLMPQIDQSKTKHYLHFASFVNLLAENGITTVADDGEQKVAETVASNCHSYVQYWWDQLEPCGYTDADTAVIFPRLRQVCMEGGDINHIFGASTVKPASTYAYKSFLAVIKAYNDSLATAPSPRVIDPFSCNGYLIDAPAPYSEQMNFGPQPIWKKPDSCQCTIIGNYYQQYQQFKLGSENFSSYLYRTTSTVLTEGTADSLRNLCNGQLTCSILADPLLLPRIFQCGVQPPCIDCGVMDTLYKKYQELFPEQDPQYNDTDDLQRQINARFLRFMNYHTGLDKSLTDYLDFMSKCPQDMNCNKALRFTGSKYQVVLVPKSNNRLDLGTGAFTLEATIKPQTNIPFNTILSNRLPTNESSIGNGGFLFLVHNDNSLLLQLSGCPNYIASANGSGVNLFDGKAHHVAVVRYADSLRFYVDGIFIPNVLSDCGGPGTPLSQRNITVNGPLFIGLDSTTAAPFPRVGFTGWMNDVRIWKVARTQEQINGNKNKLIGPNDSLAAYYRLTSADTCEQVIIDYSTNNLGLRNNGYLGRTLSKETTDPVWVGANQINYNGADYSASNNCGCDTSTTKPMLCGNLERVSTPIDLEEGACRDSANIIFTSALLKYQAYRDSIQNSFNDRYLAKCLNAGQYESLTVTHKINEYHYTLYYYDQAGNLVKTVPPAGVDISGFTTAGYYSNVANARANGTVYVPNHTMVTQYRYNSLNQVVAQQTPDAGQSNFWYDRLGRLAISQNAKQKAGATEADRYYSFTQYDYLGRIKEVGQVQNTTANGAMSNTISRSVSSLENWIAALGNNKEQVTRTYYDIAYSGIATELAQQNLRNRVSYTSITNGNSATAYNSATFYTYDIHGNVDTLLQDYGNGTLVPNIMNQNGNRFKRVVYSYDLISGKVNWVGYQPRMKDRVTGAQINPIDQFYHRYTYDAENRITAVETSRDSAVWEKDGRYEYYRHGPLARTVIGENMLQGMDYAYTLQGWLKGMNSTSLKPNYDIGEDGQGQRMHIGRDVFGFSLQYYNGDYSSINNTVQPFAGLTIPTAEQRPLYNGNISSMAVNVKALNQPYLYNYKYDQLNRLIAMDAYTGLNETNNTWAALTVTNKFKERVSYDANGNIKTYQRHHEFENAPMDDLTYYYTAGTNKLTHVKEGPNSQSWINGTKDIEDQSAENYDYDEIGNLIKDASENIAPNGIQWNVYGKIASIERTAASNTSNAKKIIYDYDAAGNRIGKKVIKFGSARVEHTWYVRDAQGNMLGVYTAGMDTTASTTLSNFALLHTESYLYGSSKLGVLNRMEDVEGTNYNGAMSTTWRGSKHFELSNHLGNVMAVISDKKLPVADPNNATLIAGYDAEVVSANDYYPFGMTSRSYNNGYGDYRTNFNGKELDKETGLQDYGERIYSMIGRFISVDPLSSEYPELTPYQFASNRPIDGIDLDGLEYSPASHSLGRENTSVKLYSKPPELIQKDFDRIKWEKAYQNQQILTTDFHGNTIIGSRKDVVQTFAVQRRDYYRAVGDNIRNGLGGSIGYMIGGDEGSFVGVAADGIFTGIAGYPIKNSTVLSRPQKDAMVKNMPNKASNTAPKSPNYSASAEGYMTIRTEPVVNKTGIKLESSVAKVMGNSYEAMGEVIVPIKNTELLNSLNATSKGNWVKVYEAGMQNGAKIETHYFRNSTTGQVFDVKTKYNYWHQKAFKNLGQ